MYFFVNEKKLEVVFSLLNITRLVESYVKGDEAEFYNLVISWGRNISKRGLIRFQS